jgi:hypothetical protein
MPCLPFAEFLDKGGTILPSDKLLEIVGAFAVRHWLEDLGADSLSGEFHDGSNRFALIPDHVAAAGAVEFHERGYGSHNSPNSILVALIFGSSSSATEDSISGGQLAIHVDDRSSRHFRCSYFDLGSKIPVGVQIASGRLLVLGLPDTSDGLLVFIEPL